MPEGPPYFCLACGKGYRTQQEADLCTPAEDIPIRYPGTEVTGQ